jgi:type IV pilus assembly protein PilM
MSFWDTLTGKKRYLGIDLGTAGIKIAQVTKEKNKFKLENYGIIQTPSYKNFIRFSGSPGEAKEADQEKIISEKIKKLAEISKFTTKNAVIGLPSSSTFISVIELPIDLSEKELKQAIPFEAKQYIPVPIEEVVLGWEILKKNIVKEKNLYVDKEKSRWQILLIATHKKTIERINRIVEGADLNLIAVEMEALANARSILKEDTANSCIIDIGHKNSDISIIENSITKISRSIELSSSTITQALSREIGINYEKAEALKIETGLKNLGTGDKVSPVIITVIDQLVQEAQKVIRLFEFSDEENPRKITKVYLAGATARMPNLASYIKNQINLPVEVANPWNDMLIPNGLQPILQKIASSFTIATGLAMRELI